MSRPLYISATGNVGGVNGGLIKQIVLTPAAAVATLVLREGGSGGNIIWSLQAAASGSSVILDFSSDIDGGSIASGQIHATLGGVGAVATIAV